ncbi:MAG TPA: hypothetical protein P5080_03545 [Candidatus Paceibacterota bacterium]|nr:hypothetical protein [Candidatus Paceibacterota bacterium]HSA36760.1 hypothetical protein [Candidatus Paceibacterota bacterium]
MTMFWSNFYFHNQRPMPDYDQRLEYFKWWKDTLKKKGRPYVVISGNWEQWFAKARNAVDRLMNGLPLKE